MKNIKTFENFDIEDDDFEADSFDFDSLKDDIIEKFGKDVTTEVVKNFLIEQGFSEKIIDDNISDLMFEIGE